MANRHKGEKTYFAQNAKAIALLFHLKLRLNDTIAFF